MPAAATSPHYEDLLTSDASPALRAQRVLAGALRPHVRAGQRGGSRARDTGALDAGRRDGAHAPRRPARQPLHPAGHPRPALRLGTRGNPGRRARGAEPRAAHARAVPHQCGGLLERAGGAGRAAEHRRARAIRTLRPVRQGLRLALSTDNTPAQANADLAVVSDALSDDPKGRLDHGPARHGDRAARRHPAQLRQPDRQAGDACACTSRARSCCSPTAPTRSLVLPEGTTTQRFAVEARASGTFTMTVSLATGDGVVPLGDPTKVSRALRGLQRRRVRRSRSARCSSSRCWWANHFRRTRRGPPRRRRRRERPRRSSRASARAWSGRAPSVALGTLLSRVTGLVRVVVLAYALGQATLADTYNLANTTPNIVYELLVGGVLSATLVPVFVDHLAAARRPRDVGGLHRHADRARRAHRGRDGVRAADRAPLLARHDRRRAGTRSCT